MNNIKEYKQLGAYGIVIKNNKILLIKKHGGPYDGKLDLPGGTIEFNEKPSHALIREFKEEVGIDITKYKLFDADSVSFNWLFKDNTINVFHTGIFYEVLEYKGEINKKIIIDNQNDDSLGAEFYTIKDIKKSQLSMIAIMELEKLGYEKIRLFQNLSIKST